MDLGLRWILVKYITRWVAQKQNLVELNLPVTETQEALIFFFSLQAVSFNLLQPTGYVIHQQV